MLLEVDNIFAGYAKNSVLNGISFALNAGEVLCVVGPNGCGKTTLFRVILGTLTANSGSVFLEGENIHSLTAAQRAKLIAYIPQNHTPVFSYTVLEIVLMGRASHLSTFERPQKKDEVATENALNIMGISHLAEDSYTTLSGGQRQLVIIARAIAQNAKLLVMDEPSASLDYANQQLLLSTIKNLTAQGFGIIVSTHNPSHPFLLGGKAMLMQGGKTVAYAPVNSAITSENLKTTYGIDMDVLSAFDKNGAEHKFCISYTRGEFT